MQDNIFTVVNFKCAWKLAIFKPHWLSNTSPITNDQSFLTAPSVPQTQGTSSDVHNISLSLYSVSEEHKMKVILLQVIGDL